jgi:hypothetical protein
MDYKIVCCRNDICLLGINCYRVRDNTFRIKCQIFNGIYWILWHKVFFFNYSFKASRQLWLFDQVYSFSSQYFLIQIKDSCLGNSLPRVWKHLYENRICTFTQTFCSDVCLYSMYLIISVNPTELKI